MKVYLIRHGEVLHNRLKIYDSSDEELTDLGIAQTKVAKDKLKMFLLMSFMLLL